MASEVVGSVSRLWIFPVKSMRGQRVEHAEFTREKGFAGDRAYAIIDTATGKVASAKSVKMFPNLLGCQATFVESPQLTGALPPVRIALPNGTTVTSDSPDTDRALSAFFGREVTLAQAAPEDFTIDMYHPDIEDADPAGRRDTVVEQRLGAAYFGQAELPSPVPPGSFFDLFPVTVLTTSTLDQLNVLRPGTSFDERRFRMNVIVNANKAGFPENDWVGRQLGIGDSARLKVIVPDARCVMTTLAQDELPPDSDVLRTLVAHNRLRLSGPKEFPCAGVYAVARAPGTICVGDTVVLI